MTDATDATCDAGDPGRLLDGESVDDDSGE